MTQKRSTALKFFFCAACFTTWTPTASFTETGRTLQLIVCVYNHAQVPAECLTQALKEVTGIYRHAGVELAWLDRPLSIAQAQGPTDYLQRLGQTSLVLRIVPSAMAEHLPISDFLDRIGGLHGSYGSAFAMCGFPGIRDKLRGHEWSDSIMDYYPLASSRESLQPV